MYLFATSVDAQTLPYGIIDTADLRMASCSFEKDANAMMLFNKCTIHYSKDNKIVFEYHKRLKIFNNNARELANMKIDCATDNNIEEINDLRAETINLNDNKIEITKVNRKDIYKLKIDKGNIRISFSFPAVKAGSVIEYSYSRPINLVFNILPDWYFQGGLPVRYSECNLSVPKGYTFKSLFNTNQIPVVNTKTQVALQNVPSLPEEPFMDSYNADLASVTFMLTSYDGKGESYNKETTWPQIGADLLFNARYGQQLNNKIKGEDYITDEVKNLSTEGKIAFIFKLVKSTMKCTDDESLQTGGWGIPVAWNKNKGNATEINLIVCRLLNQAGVVTCPLAVSTDVDHRINPKNAIFTNLDRTVAYVKTNDNKEYILDASEKSNSWDKIPYYLLNTFGLYMNLSTTSAGLIFIKDSNPARDVVSINAQIIPNGKISGTAQINSFNYNKDAKLLIYKLIGEKKYNELLLDGDNNLKITSFKLQNADSLSLPLTQDIVFEQTLQATDDKYMYFNPNLFSLLRNNPFLSETRYSAVDLKFNKYYSVAGRYKEPAGYNADGLPPDINLIMPDKSISFKRITAEQDGYIIVHFIIEYRKSYFFKDEYPALRQFSKKMFEMINEQIVLKKT
ncbi:DUF3857 domain-containing protein [Mucilaginibacter sp.]|uniref:DUF3857 domain-containing protein n=1 Tax=Mucilaginibacter sp. TaxID=1882438 RepID=UPI003D13FB1F